MDTVTSAQVRAEDMNVRVQHLEDSGALDTADAERMKVLPVRHLPERGGSGSCPRRGGCGVDWMCPPVRRVADRLAV